MFVPDCSALGRSSAGRGGRIPQNRLDAAPKLPFTSAKACGAQRFMPTYADVRGNMREISIRHGARMANRMFQVLTAHKLASLAPQTGNPCAITGHDIPEWGLSGEPSGRGHRGWPKLDGTPLDVDWLKACIADDTITTLRMSESVCDARLLPDRATANALFDASGQDHYQTGAGDLVIHVRLEDIMEPGRHTGYGPLPLSWYRQLLSETGLRPIFVGQFGKDPYSNALKHAFPDAVILEGGSVLYDFQTLRNAHNVAVGISTFSWLAAWLGAHGQIFQPLMGILNPLDHPMLNFLPECDARYRFDLFPTRKWLADEAALTSVIEGTIIPQTLDAHALTNLRIQSAALAAPDANAWRARVQAVLDTAT